MPLVLYRQADGSPACLEDKCPHKSTRLSIGRVINGTLECFYHGWCFDGTSGKVLSNRSCYTRLKCNGCPGQCNTDSRKHGTTSPERESRVPETGTKSYPCFDSQGYVWVWIGDDKPNKSQIPHFDVRARYQDGELYARFYDLDLPLDARLFMENFTDSAHVPFVHHGTFAAWAPSVHYRATLQKTLDGVKSYVEHDVSRTDDRLELHFIPPCTSFVILHEANDRFRHMIIHTLPVGPGHCRLLFSEYRNYGWWQNLFLPSDGPSPFDLLILHQDVLAISGQQQVMAEGGGGHNDHLLKQDEMACVVRRWHRKAFGGNPWWRGWDGSLDTDKLQQICDMEGPRGDNALALLRTARRAMTGGYLKDLKVQQESRLPSFLSNIHIGAGLALGLVVLGAFAMRLSSDACRYSHCR